MAIANRIVPCLWFNDQAEAAVNLYVGTFKNSRITNVLRYGEAGKEIHRREPGSVMTVAFELEGRPYTALNGGPMFRFTEAVSLQVMCESQEEVDYYWDRLAPGGDPAAQRCGWLKDRFGLSWQIVPTALVEMLGSKEPGKSQRVFAAMMPMQKIDIAALRRAFES